MVAITLMIVASSASALDRSGMFVCTPLLSIEKPIIYSFDGEYLIRDNNLKVPFTKVSSLTDNMDLYFAFEPTYIAGRKLALQRLLQQDADLITTELAEFTNHCDDYYSRNDTLETYYQRDSNSEKVVLQPILNLVDAIGDLSCAETKDDIGKFLAPVADEEFNHVKLTINFDKMWVIEERIRRGGDVERRNMNLSEFDGAEARKYECKSLGIDVPQVDTSESIVPLASNI